MLTLDTFMALSGIPIISFGVLSYQMGWGWYVLLVSSLHVMYGLRLFLRRGGPLWTASGLYGITSAMFLGLPPLWTRLTGTYSVDSLDCLVSGISFAVLALTDLISRTGKRQEHVGTAKTHMAVELHDKVPFSMLEVSVLLFVIGSLMNSVESSMAKGALYASILFSAFSAVTAISKRKWLLAGLSSMVALAILTTYLGTYFTGFGRLTIATLGISIMYVANLIWTSNSAKVVTLLASWPLLVVGAQIRLDSVVTGRSVLNDPLEGLGSMLAPYFTFRDILLHVGMPGSLKEFEFQWGKNLVRSVLFFIPRWIWPSKPPAFGNQLTLWFRPDLAPYGHSMVGSYLGEFYADFGYLGLLGAPVVLGMLLRLLDTATYRLAAGPRGPHTMYCLKLVWTSIIVGGIADYVWSGTSTLMSRVVPRLIFLIPITALGLLKRPSRTRKSGVRDTSFSRSTNVK